MGRAQRVSYEVLFDFQYQRPNDHRFEPIYNEPSSSPQLANIALVRIVLHFRYVRSRFRGVYYIVPQRMCINFIYEFVVYISSLPFEKEKKMYIQRIKQSTDHTGGQNDRNEGKKKYFETNTLLVNKIESSINNVVYSNSKAAIVTFNMPALYWKYRRWSLSRTTSAKVPCPTAQAECF